MSSSTITPISMNLTGQYATSFQAILNKAVQTATVPLTQLQTQDSAILSHKIALGSLENTVAALTASLKTLGTDGSTGALGATSSNDAAVTATNTGATNAATYVINSVTSVASATSETSISGYTDAATSPITAGTTNPGDMELMVGTTPFKFTLAANNLNSLVKQINGLGANVTASVLTTPTGNYLSLTANSTGATTLQLNDLSGASPTGITTTTNPGTDAKFQLNGIDIQQSSNTVNAVIPGLTFNVVGKSTTATTLTLASDPSQLTTDLQTFVTNYNAVQTAVKGQVGNSGGALVGDSAILQLQQAMHQMVSHFSNSTGSVQSLSDLGVTFEGIDGTLSFDPTVVSGMSTSQLADGLKYLGSTTTGLGGFYRNFDALSNSVSGLIRTEISNDTTSDAEFQKRIQTTTNQINAMQKNLAKQIENSDALESLYESQQTQLSATLQGLNLVLYGKNTANS